MNKVLQQIGIRNEDFKLFKVSDLIEQKIIEKPLDGNHGDIHPKSEDFKESGVPFIMASDINDGKVDYTNCKYIAAELAESLRKGFAQNGDVLVTHKATIGRTAIVDYSKHPFIMLTPQVTYYRVIDESKLNNRYLKYYFDSSLFQQTLRLWAGAGSTRAYLGITAQHKLPIILPPIEIQNSIAAILASYDDLIENNKCRIDKLEYLAEEIYREWFVRFRFPGYENVEFDKGLPKHWNIEELGSIVDDIIDYRGVTPAKLGSDWIENGIPAISALNVKNGNLIRMDETKKVSEELYGRWMKKELEKNDILLTSEAPLGQVSILLEKEKYVLSQRLFAIRSDKEKINPIYLYMYLLFDIGQHQIHSKATGSTVGGIRQQLLRKVEVLVPPSSKMKEFDDYVTPLLHQASILKKQILELKAIRDTMLPRLISGKLSVDDLDIQFPPSMQELTQ